MPRAASAQALPFHTSTGITAGFDENAARHFVSFAGRGGLVRDGDPVPDPAERDVDALAVVSGVIVGGLTPLWTVRVIVPWIRKEMDFTPDGSSRTSFGTSGIGDPVLQTKWIFLRHDRPGATTRVGVQARVKAPVGSTDARLPSGDRAPRSLQVGTGTWDFEPRLIVTDVDGRWGVHGNVSWRVNGTDADVDRGDAFLYDLALGVRLVPRVYRSMEDQTVVAYLELNGRSAGRDEIGGRVDPDSGGHLLHLSPALQWVPAPWLLLEGAAQIPLVQDLNGARLEHDVRVQLGTRYRFSVFR